MKDKKAFYLRMFPALFAGYLIALFLSGKIIDIPKGTHQGGVIGATGVLIIIIMTILLFTIIYKIINKYH